MTRDLSSSNGIGSLFSGKARTVAAVAAFSGLALATTVSVQATPGQDGTAADAPLSAVAAATPAAAPAVSLEPVAHVTKTEKADEPERAAKSADEKAEEKKAPAAEQAPAPAPAAAPAVEAPAPVAAPVVEAPKPVAAPAVQAPKPAAPAVEAPKPVAAPAVQAPKPAAPAVEAPKPVAAPVVQAPKPAAAPKPVAAPAVQAPKPAAAPKPVAAPVVQAPKPAAAPATTVTPQSSSSGKGATIASAAQGQLGVSQDCTALVTNALRAAGINHHGWPASYLGLGTRVSAAQAQPGDIVYYANGGSGFAHIAIYIGGGKAVHGGWNGNQTTIASVNVGSGPVYVRVA